MKTLIFSTYLFFNILLFTQTESFAQWVQSDGPFDTYINALVVSTDSSKDIFAGTDKAVFQGQASGH